MTIKKELTGELIATSGGSLIGPNGLVNELTKAPGAVRAGRRTSGPGSAKA